MGTTPLSHSSSSCRGLRLCPSHRLFARIKRDSAGSKFPVHLMLAVRGP